MSSGFGNLVDYLKANLPAKLFKLLIIKFFNSVGKLNAFEKIFIHY